MDNTLKTVCSVQLRGFMKRRIDRRKSRSIDDRAPSEALPYARPYLKIAERLGFTQKVGSILTGQVFGNNAVYTGFNVEELENDTDHNGR